MALTYWVAPEVARGTPGPRPIAAALPEEAAGIYVERLVSEVGAGWQAGRFTVSEAGTGSAAASMQA